MKTKNSNPVASNGIEVVEGCKVYWTCQDDYTRNGTFIVNRADGDLAELVRTDGSKPNYNLADFSELKVLVH